VAIQGAYVGLSLAVEVRESSGLRRRLPMAGNGWQAQSPQWRMSEYAAAAIDAAQSRTATDDRRA